MKNGIRHSILHNIINFFDNFFDSGNLNGKQYFFIDLLLIYKEVYGIYAYYYYYYYQYIMKCELGADILVGTTDTQI